VTIASGNRGHDACAAKTLVNVKPKAFKFVADKLCRFYFFKGSLWVLMKVLSPLAHVVNEWL
jgi:hypothetical protein